MKEKQSVALDSVEGGSRRGVLSRATSVLVALVLGCSIGCSFIPTYTAAAQLRAASFLPADTWLFSEVTLRPSLTQLAGATRLANAFTSQPGWDAYVQRISGPVGPQSTKLATDVLGMLDGEVAVGAFGSLGSSTAPLPQFVVLAHASDPDKLITMLASTEGISGTPPRKNAQGANVYTLPGAGGVATFQGWIVVASGANVLDQTLNRIGGGTSSGALSDEPHFKSLVGRLPADRLALEYVDSGALFRAIGSQIPLNQPGVPPETQSLLQGSESQVAVSFAAGGTGLDIRFEGATRLPPGLAGQSALSSVQWGDAGEAFAHLPQDTLAAYGFGLPPLAPQVDTAVGLTLQQVATQLEMPDLADLDLHPSQWLVGPIAIGGSAGTIGDPGGQADLFMVAKTSDTDAAQADLATITGLFPPKTVTPVSIAGTTFIAAPIGANGSVTYGVADEWLYLVSGDAQAVVDAASAGDLTQNPRFQALQSGLGEDPTNVFIDIQGARELATGMLGSRDRQMYDSEFAPLVAPLTLFGGGVRSDPNGDVHGRFLLGISGP